MRRGSSVPLLGTAGPAVAHQAGCEVGTLGTCLSVAVEEDYCRLEKKKSSCIMTEVGKEQNLRRLFCFVTEWCNVQSK